MTGSVQREVFDEKKFDAAFEAVLQMSKRDYPAYIGGLKVASGVEDMVCSPIDESICFGRFQEPEPFTEEEAVNAAVKAFESWSKISQEDRSKIIGDVYSMLETQRYRLAASVLVSSGMTKQESLFEVDAMLDILTDALEDSLQCQGKPMGTWAVITSYNSPLASPIGYALVAMLMGNTVVVLPSIYSPLPVFIVYDMCVKAGVPDGVLNLFVDRKDQTAIDLANNDMLAGVVASGSGKFLEDMMFLMVNDQLGFHNEIKGMNPILIHKPSDMKKAVKDVLDSAFRYMGQGLYSTSKVVVTIDEQKKFTDLLMEQVKTLNIMDPAETQAFCGPIISAENKKRFQVILKEKASNVMYGGREVLSEFTQNGAYMTPAILVGLDDEDEAAYMDAGLPMLYVKVVADIDEAFEELAYTECGLSAGIYSKDQSVIERFKSESDLACVFVNGSSRNLKPGLYAKVGNFVN